MIGPRRERVTIQDQTQTIDAAGAITTSWAPIAGSTVWARMSPASERTMVVAGRDEALVDWLCTIRHRSDVTTRMRVVWRGRIFDIQGFRNADERRQYLLIRLLERSAGA